MSPDDCCDCSASPRKLSLALDVKMASLKVVSVAPAVLSTVRVALAVPGSAPSAASSVHVSRSGSNLSMVTRGFVLLSLAPVVIPVTALSIVSRLSLTTGRTPSRLVPVG